jgi:hypothetical protein
MPFIRGLNNFEIDQINKTLNSMIDLIFVERNQPLGSKLLTRK